MGDSALSMAGRLGEGSTVEWWTPPHVFDAIGLEFDLDPCAPVGGVPWLPAKRSLSVHDNGLATPWEGRVWLNPPYGRDCPRWVGKLIDHGDGIALVFARTDAAWAQRALWCASAVCFIAGRLSFVDGLNRQRRGHNAAASSMLLAYGDTCAEAILGCSLGITFGQAVEATLQSLDPAPAPGEKQ